VNALPNPFDFRRRVPGRSFVRTAWWDFCALLCWSALKICYGLRRTHRDRIPRTGAILVISNHQSYLDPMVNGVTVWDRQFTALARDTLFVGPWGWVLRSVSARPIKRSGGDLEAMRAAIAELEAGRVVILYPEGTRSPDGELQEFKRGVMLLVKRVKPTVLPMGVDGAFDAWPRGRKVPRVRGKVVCACGAPLDGAALAAMTEADALAAMHGAVATAFADARAELRAWQTGAER
jgi:1-acyl-sn-glycerol-3-phosphate acyltransferase